MKKIGIISDTHNFFDETLRDFLTEVDEIWHAGDFGSIELADSLAEFKPLKGVWGNIDGGKTRLAFGEFNFFECEGVKVLLTHIGGYSGRYNTKAYQKLLEHRPDIFVCGHSHILKVGYDKKNAWLNINPGAAGISGFHSVRTAIRLTLDNGTIKDMEVGQWPRRK
ncbi:MAG: metallophosphoesterase family protein [Rikenellaceae bacterium]